MAAEMSSWQEDSAYGEAQRLLSIFSELSLPPYSSDEEWTLYRQCLSMPLTDQDGVYIPIVQNDCGKMDIGMISELGRGSYATVWKIIGGDGNYYALKRFDRRDRDDNDDDDDDGALLRLVRREECLLSTINNPRVVKLHCTMVDSYMPMLLLELIPGEELFDVIFSPEKISASSKKIRVESREIPWIVAQIVTVLHDLHQQGIIYHDLKMENIMLMPKDLRIKLVDFGLAVRVSDWRNDRVKILCGSTDYMAPEVLLDLPHGVAADWYSLGVIIHEMESRRAYFEAADDEGAVLRKKMQGLPCRLVNRRVACNLIEQLWRFEPDLRWGDEQIEAIRNHPYFAGVDWSQV